MKNEKKKVVFMLFFSQMKGKKTKKPPVCSLSESFCMSCYFNSIQFSFIYIAPNYNNCHLKALK